MEKLESGTLVEYLTKLTKDGEIAWHLFSTGYRADFKSPVYPHSQLIISLKTPGTYTGPGELWVTKVDGYADIISIICDPKCLDNLVNSVENKCNKLKERDTEILVAEIKTLGSRPVIDVNR